MRRREYNFNFISDETVILTTRNYVTQPFGFTVDVNAKSRDRKNGNVTPTDPSYQADVQVHEITELQIPEDAMLPEVKIQKQRAINQDRLHHAYDVCEKYKNDTRLR